METEPIEEQGAEICQNELPPAPEYLVDEDILDEDILEYEPLPGTVIQNCKNELLASPWNAQRITECLDEEFNGLIPVPRSGTFRRLRRLAVRFNAWSSSSQNAISHFSPHPAS